MFRTAAGWLRCTPCLETVAQVDVSVFLCTDVSMCCASAGDQQCVWQSPSAKQFLNRGGWQLSSTALWTSRPGSVWNGRLKAKLHGPWQIREVTFLICKMNVGPKFCKFPSTLISCGLLACCWSCSWMELTGRMLVIKLARLCQACHTRSWAQLGCMLWQQFIFWVRSTIRHTPVKKLKPQNEKRHRHTQASYQRHYTP